MKNAYSPVQKAAALLLTLLTLCSACLLAACKKDIAPAPASDAASTAPTEPVTEPAGPAFTVDAANAAGVLVVRPEDANGVLTSLAAAFRTELSTRTGADLRILDDFLRPGEAENPELPELLVGDTNRAATAELRAKLDALGGPGWGILQSGGKLAVLGTTDLLTYRALDYLLESLLTPGADGKSALDLPDGFVYVADAAGEKSVGTFEISELIASGKGIRFCTDGVAVSVPREGGYATMQGGGTDGRYAYYAMNSGGTPGNCVIYKYDTETWSLVGKSGVIEAGHSNDITYDPTRRLLAICTNCARDSWSGICFVDPETLTTVSCDVLVNNCAIEFCEKTGGYVFETWSTVEGKTVFTTVHTDTEFKETSRWYQGNSEHTCQGFCDDGDYLLCVRYVSGKDTHYITLHTLEGEFIGKMPLTGAVGEPENMFRLGDFYYLGCNKSSKVYRVVAMPEKWW